MSKKESNPNVTYIKVVDHVSTEVTRYATRAEWDNDDTEESHDIQGLEVVDNPDIGYHDLVVNFPVEKNVNYFLLYVSYDTGDSFGRYCGKVEFVSLFKEESEALVARKKILKMKEITSIQIDNNGHKETVYNGSWTGYFESVNGIYVETVRRIK